MREKLPNMAKRLGVHDIRQFDENGIRENRKKKYQLREGIIRWGAETESFYIDRAERLYKYDAVDRIILLSRKGERISLERLARDILDKTSNEWRRAPDDRLIREGEYLFTDSIEIIDSEMRGKKENVNMIQINLVSNLYFAANHYISRVNENPNTLPMHLVRVLAGLYPKEWKEKPEDLPHYDPKDVLELLIQMTSDRALMEYFGFFRSFFTKKHWSIEEILRKLEPILEIETPTRIHAGLYDLRQILTIIHSSLSAETVSNIAELKNDIDSYFQTVPEPEQYTDMLFGIFQNLFEFLQKFEEVDDSYSKLYFLEESRKKIRESEILVDNKFVQPFKEFYLDGLKRWMDITFKEGEKLLSRAFLTAILQTKRAEWKEKLRVSISIRNVGIGPARHIQVSLHRSQNYGILGEERKSVDVLRRNETVDVEFQIEPSREDILDLTFSVSYAGGKGIEISDTLVFVQKEEFIPFDNPYYFTKPAEGDMFFGRDDLFQWIESNMKGPVVYQNVQLKGQRRAGKTSFLRELHKRLSKDCYCVFIDMQVELNPDSNDVGVLRRICEKLHEGVPNNIPPPTELDFAKKSYAAFGGYIKDLLENVAKNNEENDEDGGPKGIVLILDEFDKVESEIREKRFRPAFLSYFRGFFQRYDRVSGIISGNFDFLCSSEWQEFFTVFNPKRVEVLDRDAAEDLVTKPVKDVLQYDRYAIKKILDFSGRNPYYIQVICHILVEYINEEKKQNFVEAEDVSVAILDKAKEKTDPTLQLTWNELDATEKNILFALSQLSSQYKRSIGLDELYQHLIQNNIKMKRWKVRSLLGSLEEKDIVIRLEGFPPYHNFNIILLRDWIAEKGSFIGE